MTQTAVQTPTRSVPIKSLVLELSQNGIVWRNPRQFTGLSTEDIKELAEEIHHNGLMTPVIVERYHLGAGAENQVDLVADGQRRVLALRYLIDNKRLAADAKIDVVDLHPEPIAFTRENAADTLLDALASANYREPLTSYEQTEAAVIARAGGKTQHEIALRLGRSKAWVSRMLSARDKASGHVVAAWKDGKITDEQFKELAEVSPAKQPEAVAKIVELRERGERALARMESKEAVPEKAPHQPPAGKPANGANGANGHAKAASVSAVEPEKSPSSPAVVAVKGKAKIDDPTPKPRSTVVADLARLRGEHPAKDPYMMGILDCAAYVSGTITEAVFRKPYHQYMNKLATGAKRPGPKAKPTAAKAPSKKTKKASKKK